MAAVFLLITFGSVRLGFWQQFFAFGLADVGNVEPIAALVLN